jgi:hypothetical protein
MLSRMRASITSLYLVSGLLVHGLRNPIADRFVSLLRLRWGGGDAGADGPHWLVRNHHLFTTK